jgi:hypothetical protein
VGESPDATSASSTLPTPSLPWSDSSLTSFLEHDTSIRDAVILIHEGGRLLRKPENVSINPQIADLYNICTIHIEEMASVSIPSILFRLTSYLQHLDDVLMSYLFEAKK